MLSSRGIQTRAMIAPETGSATMPVSHPEQGCGARRPPVPLGGQTRDRGAIRDRQRSGREHAASVIASSPN
jgi:hypothetical protein